MATVNTTVDDHNRTVTFTVEEIGDGEEVLLGPLDDSGDSMTLDADETLADEGDVSVIMNDGDSEYAVSSVEWDWATNE
ncbi:hypothetical protein Htur_2259 [Haloterrigena turkmenica DSM 5511]|uniref:Uncharacterized protein n=1 Tax=Haloterrigena turkmenica (strain ATCC 51198 / DSM 5511 / JCM 9101 / NCIMB 13204 / VKM B-1734 / 4k) TaxID=543526 RepID=D2RUG7_HALTV|nr:hypothetical protein Htur_2259 [Haloterrigena turkmenica DSM 5511]